VLLIVMFLLLRVGSRPGGIRPAASSVTPIRNRLCNEHRVLDTVLGPTKGVAVLRHALTHYLQLGSIREEDWVAAQFGYR
jgi:hypothetical protein